MWGEENVECAWDEEKEIGMSRQVMYIKNLKKLGDVVRISSEGKNGYECWVRHADCWGLPFDVY